MGVRNNHWTNRNELVAYPVDESASTRTDTGAYLPSNIISDINLRWPDTYGKVAFIGGISVTERLVTVTIQAAADITDSSSFVPLCAVTLVKPVEEARAYAVEPLMAGVGGWIVFGSGIAENFQGRFSLPTQSLLAPRAARAYRALPVTGSGVLHADTPLTGLVRLRAESPFSITKEEREIRGVLRDVLVFRLVDEGNQFPVPGVAADLLPNQDDNIFREFAGPCGKRPESNSCGNPTPIEFINAVGPDCDGRITVEFQGCAALTPLDGRCGAVVDCPMGLVDACIPPKIPNSEGLLPSEAEPRNITPPTPEPPDPDPGPISESVSVVGELPYLECFRDDTADDFQVINGLWSIVGDFDPYNEQCNQDSESSSNSLSHQNARVLAANSVAANNLITWDGFDVSTLGRKVRTHLKLPASQVGALHSAGLVLNYRPHLNLPGRYVYYAARMDYDNQRLAIHRFNGTSLQLATDVFVPGIVLDEWYEMEVDVGVGSPANRTEITVSLKSLESSVVDVTLGPLAVTNYLPSSGHFGFIAERSSARFSFFEVLSL